MITIEYKGHTFSENAIAPGGRCVRNFSPLSDTLPIDTLEITLVDDGSKDLNSFTYGDVIKYKVDGITIGTFFVETVKRTSKHTWKIYAMSVEGILDKAIQRGYGSIYNTDSVESFLKIIFEGMSDIGYTVKGDMAGTQLQGYVEYGNAREALSSVLFACGAVMTKDENGMPIFSFFVDNEKEIPANRVGVGGTIEAKEKIGYIQVTEHNYVESADTAKIKIFDNSAGDEVSNQLVILPRPSHSRSATGTITGGRGLGGRLSAYLSGKGTFSIVPYEDNPIIRTEATKVSDATKTLAANTNIYTVTALNSENVAKRVAAYHAAYGVADCDILLEDEAPGDMVKFIDPFGNEASGIILSLDETISKQRVAKAKILLGYTPGPRGAEFKNYIIVGAENGSINATWNTSTGQIVRSTGTVLATLPTGLEKVRVCIVGGGQGGSGGSSGENGEAGKNSGSAGGAGGAGGVGGTGGVGGNVYIVDIEAPSGSYNMATGAGGSGGAAGNDGSYGTESTFGQYSSSSGTRSENGVRNLVAPSSTYGCRGKSGEAGYTGGQGGARRTSGYSGLGDSTSPHHNVFGQGGTSTYYESHYGGGGGGGGAAYDTDDVASALNGEDGHETTSAQRYRNVGGKGGRGANAKFHAETPTMRNLGGYGYGYGGTGGDGGGGGGGGGSCGAFGIYDDPGTGGSGGVGSAGNQGGHGCIIIYY